MGTKFLALSFSLCLLLSSFYEVSSQDETVGLSLDLIEQEYQASVNSLQGNAETDQFAGNQTSGQNNSTATDINVVKRQKMLEEIEREFEAAAAGFEKLKIDDSTQGKDDEESAKRQSMLEEIERDFEAATKGLEQLKADDLTGINDEEHAARRQKMLEEIEREFEEATKGLEQLKTDDLTGLNSEDAARRQKMLEEIERDFEEATKGLEELRHSTSSTNDESHSAMRENMLNEIEREFEATTSGLKELKINDYTNKDDDEEHAARRQSMLDAIEREFEAVTESFKQLDELAENKDDGEQSAKRQSMLDEIEREFEAATSALKQLKVEDFTEGDDSELSAKRNSMLEAIEREFEAATKSLEELKANDSTQGNDDDDEHIARRKSMLEAIEREFEAATKGLEEMKNDVEQEESKRKIMLEEIEREFEAASAKAKVEDIASKNPSTISMVQKTYGGYNAGVKSFLKPDDGVCGCFNQDKDGLKADIDSSINIAEIIAEESKSQDSQTSTLTTSLTNLVHTHRQETSSKVVTVLGSPSITSTTSESAATSESIESLKETLKKLRGLSARDLVNHPNFDEIIAAGTRYEVLSSSSVGYISLLAKYKTVIKEGMEASQRVEVAQTRAKLLKETAMEKQRSVDSVFTSAKLLAQRGDALYIRIFAIKKLLTKLGEEKENVDSKFKSLQTTLSLLLKEASQAYEEYHEAVRKAKDEQATEEFAMETTKRAEHIWVEFLSSLY